MAVKEMYIQNKCHLSPLMFTECIESSKSQVMSQSKHVFPFYSFKIDELLKTKSPLFP